MNASTIASVYPSSYVLEVPVASRDIVEIRLVDQTLSQSNGQSDQHKSNGSDDSEDKSDDHSNAHHSYNQSPQPKLRRSTNPFDDDFDDTINISTNLSTKQSIQHAERGMFAIRDIDPGELILIEQSLCHSLKASFIERHCTNCLIDMTDQTPINQSIDQSIHRCNECRSVCYCSSECLSDHAFIHQFECKALQRYHSINQSTNQSVKQSISESLLESHILWLIVRLVSMDIYFNHISDNSSSVSIIPSNNQLNAQSDGHSTDQSDDQSINRPNNQSDDQAKNDEPSNVSKIKQQWQKAQSMSTNSSLFDQSNDRSNNQPNDQLNKLIELVRYLMSDMIDTAITRSNNRQHRMSDHTSQRSIDQSINQSVTDWSLRIACSSFGCSDENINLIGCSMHVTAALINHSCVPNTRCSNLTVKQSNDQLTNQSINQSKNSLMLQVCAIKAVKKGEQLFHSYYDINQPHYQRQQVNQKYGFVCHCALCRPSTRQSNNQSNDHVYRQQRSESINSHDLFFAGYTCWLTEACRGLLGWIRNNPSINQSIDQPDDVVNCSTCHQFTTKGTVLERCESIDRSINQTNSLSLSVSIDQSINQSINQSITPSIKQSIDRLKSVFSLGHSYVYRFAMNHLIKTYNSQSDNQSRKEAIEAILEILVARSYTTALASGEIDQSNEQWNETNKHSVSQSNKQSINQSIDQSIQSNDQLIEPSSDYHSADLPVDFDWAIKLDRSSDRVGNVNELFWSIEYIRVCRSMNQSVDEQWLDCLIRRAKIAYGIEHPIYQKAARLKTD